MALHIKWFQRVGVKTKRDKKHKSLTKTIANWSLSQINKYCALPGMFRNLGKKPQKEPWGGTNLAHQVVLQLINPTFPWAWEYYWVTFFFLMDKLFLNNLQDINKPLWWVNQRGQFCPQSPEKFPSQNNHHHNQAVRQTRTPQIPVPLVSSGWAILCHFWSINPRPQSTMGKSHSVATFKRTPEPIGWVSSINLYFLN